MSSSNKNRAFPITEFLESVTSVGITEIIALHSVSPRAVLGENHPRSIDPIRTERNEMR